MAAQLVLAALPPARQHRDRVLVYLLLIVVAASTWRRRPGWPYRAGACVARRWRRRRLDAARDRFPPPPMVVRAARPLTPST
jgi:hypothetical protein